LFGLFLFCFDFCLCQRAHTPMQRSSILILCASVLVIFSSFHSSCSRLQTHGAVDVWRRAHTHDSHLITPLSAGYCIVFTAAAAGFKHTVLLTSGAAHIHTILILITPLSIGYCIAFTAAVAGFKRMVLLTSGAAHTRGDAELMGPPFRYMASSDAVAADVEKHMLGWQPVSVTATPPPPSSLLLIADDDDNNNNKVNNDVDGFGVDVETPPLPTSGGITRLLVKQCTTAATAAAAAAADAAAVAVGGSGVCGGGGVDDAGVPLIALVWSTVDSDNSGDGLNLAAATDALVTTLDKAANANTDAAAATADTAAGGDDDGDSSVENGDGVVVASFGFGVVAEGGKHMRVPPCWATVFGGPTPDGVFL
jgi:hypothetical protein